MNTYRVIVSGTAIVHTEIKIKARSAKHAMEIAEKKAYEHDLEFEIGEGNEVYDIIIDPENVEEV